METEISKILIDLSTYSSLIPILVLLWRSRELSAEKKIIGTYVVLRILTEFLAIYTSTYLRINNRPLLHFYTIIEFSLLAYLFGNTLKKIFKPKILYTLIVFFFCLAIWNGFFGEGFKNFNSYVRALESLILILFTLTYFYNLLRELVITRIELEPVIWVSIGVLLYFSGSLFLFLISNILDHETTQILSLTIWGIHAILNIILNICLAIALWVRPQK